MPYKDPERRRQFLAQYNRDRRATDEEFRLRTNAQANKSKVVRRLRDPIGTKARRKSRARAETLQKYGLTEAQYAATLAVQENCCAICRRNRDLFDRSLHVDHDHATGRVRGLLCFDCNSGLGKFQDSPELLERAALYLKEQSP